jgi:hypothetical protein
LISRYFFLKQVVKESLTSSKEVPDASGMTINGLDNDDKRLKPSALRVGEDL